MAVSNWQAALDVMGKDCSGLLLRHSQLILWGELAGVTSEMGRVM